MASQDDIEKALTLLKQCQAEYVTKKVSTSWFVASREDRKHRLHTITTLIIELERIKAVSIFSTAFGEQCIEAIIMGDWDEAEDCVSLLSFKGEDESLRARYEPLWKDFVLVARTAATWARQHADGTLAKG